MKIMAIYDFVIENSCEVQFYDYGDDNQQLLIFIDSLYIGDFTHLLDIEFCSCLDDGGLEAYIVHGGCLCIDIMPIIQYTCDYDKIEETIKLFKRHCSK